MLGKKQDDVAKRSGQSKTGSNRPADPRRNAAVHPSQLRLPAQKMETASGEHAARGNNKNWQVELSQQILVQHGQSGLGGADWMSKLKQESANYLQEQKGAGAAQFQIGSAYKRGIEILIDKIFAQLQTFTYEFNKVAAGTDLHVSGSVSGDVTEVISYNKFREPQETATYFRARFSTRLYSLVFRGRDESVDVFLLPANLSMALSKGENEYPPLTTIQVKIQEDGMMWRLAEGGPPVDSLENLCMWLFSQLVQKTKIALAEASE